MLTETPIQVPSPTAAQRDLRTRFAGFAALLFVAIVALHNVLRGASSPDNGAGGAEVLAYYSDHRALTFFLVGSFALTGPALATFVGGAMRRLYAGARPTYAIIGAIAAAGLMALWASVVITEQALWLLSAGDQPELGAIEAVWALHHSAFTALFVFLSIALFSLARAGVGAGLTPRIFDRIAPVGAAFLAVGAMAGPAIAAGDAMPLFGLSGLGFLVWLAFLLTTGLRLVRTAD